jgi:tetratricopeptide (TPR) repeat protein
VFDTKPNAFLHAVAPRLPFGRALCLGAGEGHNPVFLAARGLAVTAVDASALALQKTQRLAAARGVSITTVVADLCDYFVAPGQWDAIVLLFVHLPAAQRRDLHTRALQGLRTGGALVLEGFALVPGELSGTEPLMHLGDLQHGFSALDQALANSCWRELDEGPLHMGRRYVTQILAYRRVCEADPSAQVALLRQQAAQYMHDPGAALEALNAAVALQPQDASLHYNRAVVLRQLERLPEALAGYDDALALRPEYPQALANRANVLQDMLRLDAALQAYEAALAVRPEAAHVRLNQALCVLRSGNLTQGWPLFEARHQVAGYQRSHYTGTAALWLGQTDLLGHTLLLYAEQGLGDTLQMLRYVPLLAARGARVLLHLPATLLPLVRGMTGVSGCTALGQVLPEHDLQCPMLSLPLAFKTTLNSIPAATGYLQVDAARRTHWQQVLGAASGLRVGLIASGDPRHARDAQRSLGLAALVAALPADLQTFCLQRELRAADRQTLQEQPQVRAFGAQLRDMADTAALCSLMDVVISVDTAVAHLSAALGCPTWVLLAHVPDWRWLLAREDSPWYTSVRLLRQSQAGQWGDVLQRVAEEIRK